MIGYTQVERTKKSQVKVRDTWNFALVHQCWYVTQSHIVSDILLLVHCGQTWFRATVANQLWGIVRSGDLRNRPLWPCCHTALSTCGLSERLKIELH